MYFPTTQWTQLAQASVNGDTAGRQALDDMCRRYWAPLYQFVRSRGYSEEAAQDLTQEFLLHLLEDSRFRKADRLRGRFRSFLCGALIRFLAGEYERRQALKRGGAAVHVSLENQGAALAGVSEADEAFFDREWAMGILENALRAAQDEFEARGAGTQFAVLRRFLPGSLEMPAYEEAAGQLGLSLAAFKSELHRLRQRFKALVRQEVTATVSAPHEIEEEMNYLQRVLMDKGSNFQEGAKPLPAVS